MVDITRTGLSGLMASQRSLATTSHNITNVNTAGYTRQRANLISSRPEYISGGVAYPQYIGTGVSVQSVTRVYDQFLTQQVRSYSSNVGQLETQDQWISQLDGILGDGSTGLTPALNQFFASAQDVANSPASLPVRQALLGQAETLAGQFNALDSQMNTLRDGVNQELRGTVTTINGLAENIAKANAAIVGSPGGGAAASPDLLDQRDQLVADLAQKVSVNTAIQSDGSMSVFIGKGQSLVMGVNASVLETKPSSSDSRKLDIQFKQTGAVITDTFNSGEVGGLLTFQNQVLDPAQNKLGLMAAGLAETFNEQHKLGLDLNGDAGDDFFNIETPQAIPNANNNKATNANLAVTITDINQVKPSDYEVKYDGVNYTMRRLSDDQVVYNNTAFPPATPVEGLTINLNSGSISPGDGFLIQPTRLMATSFGVKIKDPSLFAAADSAGGVGNNANALKLAALQTEKTLLNGSSTYQDLYSQTVSQVGTQGNQTHSTLLSQQALLEQATQARDGVSGVNLDEEAANLMRYQQAYEASAKVIQVGDSIIQTLLAAVRG